MRFMLTLVVAVVLTATLATAQTVGPITVPTQPLTVVTDAYDNVQVQAPSPSNTRQGIIIPIDVRVDLNALATTPAGVDPAFWRSSSSADQDRIYRAKNNMVHLNTTALTVRDQALFSEGVTRVKPVCLGRCMANIAKTGPGAPFPVTYVRGLSMRGVDGSVISLKGLMTPYVNPDTGEIVAGKIEINPDYVLDMTTVMRETIRAVSGFTGINPRSGGLFSFFGDQEMPNEEEVLVILGRIDAPLLARKP